MHELAHNLPVDLNQWATARRADDDVVSQLRDEAMLRPREMEQVADPSRRARWSARLAPGGVTPYGETHELEDIAESMRLLLLERSKGVPFAEATDSSGAVRAVRFSEAYPQRTAVLELAARDDLNGDGVIG